MHVSHFEGIEAFPYRGRASARPSPTVRKRGPPLLNALRLGRCNRGRRGVHRQPRREHGQLLHHPGRRRGHGHGLSVWHDLERHLFRDQGQEDQPLDQQRDHHAVEDLDPEARRHESRHAVHGAEVRPLPRREDPASERDVQDRRQPLRRLHGKDDPAPLRRSAQSHVPRSRRRGSRPGRDDRAGTERVADLRRHGHPPDRRRATALPN
jgi:hypothetical protein